jgi:hypothetical protein
MEGGIFTSGIEENFSKSDVNEVYPTLETKIAPVKSSGSSSSKKSVSYIVPYLVSTTETLVVMREIHHT